jgi:hypothetical protein
MFKENVDKKMKKQQIKIKELNYKAKERKK